MKNKHVGQLKRLRKKFKLSSKDVAVLQATDGFVALLGPMSFKQTKLLLMYAELIGVDLKGNR